MSDGTCHDCYNPGCTHPAPDRERYCSAGCEIAHLRAEITRMWLRTQELEAVEGGLLGVINRLTTQIKDGGASVTPEEYRLLKRVQELEAEIERHRAENARLTERVRELEESVAEWRRVHDADSERFKRQEQCINVWKKEVRSWQDMFKPNSARLAQAEKRVRELEAEIERHRAENARLTEEITASRRAQLSVQQGSQRLMIESTRLLDRVQELEAVEAGLLGVISRLAAQTKDRGVNVTPEEHWLAGRVRMLEAEIKRQGLIISDQQFAMAASTLVHEADDNNYHRMEARLKQVEGLLREWKAALHNFKSDQDAGFRGSIAFIGLERCGIKTATLFHPEQESRVCSNTTEVKEI